MGVFGVIQKAGYFTADECPDIPYEYLTEKHLLFDLVYNPEETLFMQKGISSGANAKNGLEMLHHQAYTSKFSIV